MAASQHAPQLRQQLKTLFDSFDAQGKGLSLTEFKELTSSLGKNLPTAELRQLFEDADVNDSGRISFPEFFEAWTVGAVSDEEGLLANLQERAEDAFLDRDYVVAVQLFADAAKLDPDNPDLQASLALARSMLARNITKPAKPPPGPPPPPHGTEGAEREEQEQEEEEAEEEDAELTRAVSKIQNWTRARQVRMVVRMTASFKRRRDAREEDVAALRRLPTALGAEIKAQAGPNDGGDQNAMQAPPGSAATLRKPNVLASLALAVLSALGFGGWAKTRRFMPSGILAIVAAAAGAFAYLAKGAPTVGSAALGGAAEAVRSGTRGVHTVTLGLHKVAQHLDDKATESKERHAEREAAKLAAEQEAAAVRIQALQRGKLGRKAYAEAYARSAPPGTSKAAAMVAADKAAGGGLAMSALLDAGEDIEEIFDRLDTDKSGKLDFNELKKLVEQSGNEDITEADLRAMLAAGDKDGDGTLDKKEIVGMMQRHADDIAALSAEVAALKARFDTRGEVGEAARAAHEAAMKIAPGYVAKGWRREESKRTQAIPGASVYRKLTAKVVKDAVEPFKTRGVVEGVPPMTLAMIVTEKLSDIKLKSKAGGECKVLRHLDWQTSVWYERDKYPWPLGAIAKAHTLFRYDTYDTLLLRFAFQRKRTI
jgi:Ca2+-binding EF-hand superfamily protein